MLYEIENEHVANNYHPLPIMADYAQESYIWDEEGRRYYDLLAAYSALNLGHRHPDVTAVAHRQLDTLVNTGRAIWHNKLKPFTAALSELTNKDLVLPMNSGAEGVETAIKMARKWAADERGIPKNESNIIVMENNFHGRTTTIVSFSTDPDAKNGFGPFTPGFTIVPYGNAAALRQAIADNPKTAAVLLEPVQGEAGVIIPPTGYLQDVRKICTESNVLMMADEIQSGMGRTGKTFACDHEGVVPDVYILGKALGGGIMPLSAVAANRDVMGVFHPGEHGSTFGGNPFASAIGSKVIEIFQTGEPQAMAVERGLLLRRRLGELVGRGVKDFRIIGFWAGIDIDEAYGSGRRISEIGASKGIIIKETHGSTLRWSAPLIMTENDVNDSVDILGESLEEAA